jgi:hypothetical protein
VKINFFVLDRSPKSFNEYIITPGAFAVHADPDAVVVLPEYSSELILLPFINRQG